MTLDAWQRLKARTDDLRRRSDQAQGALEQLLASLARDFGCKDLEAAKKRLAGLKREGKRLEAEFGAAAEEFEAKHGEKLR